MAMSKLSLHMPMTLDQIAKEALALPSEARALLADRLVESLDAAEVNRLDKLWAAEAKRRRDEVRQGRVNTVPGDEGLAKVRRSVGR
jgi:putative addiction module component (TIGR02574 family)